MDETRAVWKAGLKECTRAIKAGKATKLYVALDADEYVTRTIIKDAQELGVEVVNIGTMQELGQRAGIDIGTAVAVEIKIH